MTKCPTNLNPSKSREQVIFEYIALVVCLCVIALRTTLTEGLNAPSLNLPVDLSDCLYSLSISAVLIILLALRLILTIFRNGFPYRFTGIETGLCIFTTAAFIAGAAASNKRAAITDFATLLASVLMAVLLVQILDSHAKIKLLLVVIAALGVASAWQCAEQFLTGNQMLIDQYTQNPQAFLEPLGVEPGTLQHWLLEHRLYSRGVRGFFTNSNSAGSFAILASFAAIALFIDKFKNRKASSSGTASLIACGIAAAAVLLGLVITQSKGAIAAFIIASAMFIACLLFTAGLKKYKKTILTLCLLLFLAGICAVVQYGLTHGRLPGGNSMLVRWQYWCGAAEMYADHPLTGIGPGNFGNLYPRYKPPAAIEAVVDPHNFLLSILTQYGPLGLAGFLTMILLPLWKITSPAGTSATLKTHQSQEKFKLPVIVSLIAISAVLLLIRPIIAPIPADETTGLDVMIYVIFTLYIVPVLTFLVGFRLLTAGQKTAASAAVNTTAAALFCACLGCLIHNLIDFAIFEPGVFSTFWAVMACLIALHLLRNPPLQAALKPALPVKILTLTAAVAVIWAYFNYAFIPIAKSTAKITQARQAASNGQFQQAHILLSAAATDDPLSPVALSFNGRLYLQQFSLSTPKQLDLLLSAQDCLLNAIARNKVDYKNFERLTDVYSLLAENSAQSEKSDWLDKALDSADNAVERYPGNAQLRIELAKIAEQLGKTNLALTNYKKAVDIEDSFRSQFKIMYPDRKMFSRLGEEKYQSAKQRIELLSEQRRP